jgi:hypothetical protein
MNTTKNSFKKQSSGRGRSAAIATVAVIIVAGAAFGAYSLLHKDPVKIADASDSQAAKSDFAGDSQKTVPENTPTPDANGTDQNGVISSSTPSSSQWSKSKDGSSVIVYSPAKNGLLTSGASVFGTAKSSSVSYRLSDNEAGPLASDTAKVVDGKFSIKLTFSTSASTGTVEIFNQPDPYGPESNNVVIPVRFK